MCLAAGAAGWPPIPAKAPNPGWERWVKTWCLDFVSTYQIYWNVPWDKLDVSELPNRAFDSPAQTAETAALADDYNHSGMEITPEIDARFARLAEERIRRIRCGITCGCRWAAWPICGCARAWRICPSIWTGGSMRITTWRREFSWAYAGLNALYLLLGVAGLCLRPRFWGALLAYMLLRSALLLTVVAPEARYTLECFPMLFALGGVALAARSRRRVYLSKLKASSGRG